MFLGYHSPLLLWVVKITSLVLNNRFSIAVIFFDDFVNSLLWQINNFLVYLMFLTNDSMTAENKALYINETYIYNYIYNIYVIN